jgi:predicted enzyme related to lactoylglutathione lyase
MTRLDGGPGSVSWVDLATPDVEAARRFYGELFGWSFESMPGGGYVYALLGGRKAAGMVALGPSSTMKPMWSVYFASDDADATARAAGEAGARTIFGPLEAADQGRVAYFADPTGALFGVWQGRAHRGAEVADEPGAMEWHEVYTRDVAAARAFYAGVFRLEPRALDAPGIDYWTLHRPGGDGEVVCGAMQMTAQFPPEVPSHWNTYFAVREVDGAVDRVVALGGAVVAPAFDTPFGRLAFVADPFGAAFCVIAPTRLPGT